MVESNLQGCKPADGAYTDLYLHNKHDGLGKPLGDCSRKEIAAYCKDLACAYLEKTGLTVVDRAWFSTVGAADIVARDGKWGILVEVRPSVLKEGNREDPVEIVVGAKARVHFQNSTISYYSKHSALKGVRYDVIAMRLHSAHEAKLRHFVGAYGYRS